MHMIGRDEVREWSPTLGGTACGCCAMSVRVLHSHHPLTLSPQRLLALSSWQRHSSPPDGCQPDCTTCWCEVLWHRPQTSTWNLITPNLEWERDHWSKCTQHMSSCQPHHITFRGNPSSQCWQCTPLTTQAPLHCQCIPHSSRYLNNKA